MSEFVILIPSYKPDEHLKDVVSAMLEAGFSRVVVVDDGGGEAYRVHFDALKPLTGVTVLHHEVNRGKGAALKTGLSYIAERFSDSLSVITVDADGQHRPKDVMVVADAARLRPDAVVLGSRNFTLPQVPFRSRFGNRLTSGVFRLFCGVRIGDTQTGLRAIPVSSIPAMLDISGDRYEYETNVLLQLKGLGIPLVEVEIETVYIDNNSASHFNPVRDSLRIYGLIFKFYAHSLLRVGKFSASSLLCTGVDFALFYVLHLFFSASFGLFGDAICQALARIASSLLNFVINRNLVFAGRGARLSHPFVRYYAVAIPLLIVSAFLLNGITLLFSVTASIGATVVKFFVDLFLFIFSYRLQRDWVFKGTNK